MPDQMMGHGIDKICKTCLYSVVTKPTGEETPSAGHCRRHAPEAWIGWPSIFWMDWCGDWEISYDNTKVYG